MIPGIRTWISFGRPLLVYHVERLFTPYHFLLVSIYLNLLPQALYEEHVVEKPPSWELGNLRPFTHQHRCLPPYLCPGQTLLMRESIPRQVDKKSGVPEEEKGVWGSQGGAKDKHLFFFFFSTFLSLRLIKRVFHLSLELRITQQTQFKLCTKDYITTMCPA